VGDVVGGTLGTPGVVVPPGIKQVVVVTGGPVVTRGSSLT